MKNMIATIEKELKVSAPTIPAAMFLQVSFCPREKRN
jgi:hypothetical protein